MTDEPVLANTTLPLFFYELIEDLRREPELPKSKGFGSGPYSVTLPKDRRLQVIVIIAELGSKLDAIDRYVGRPGRTLANPHIEAAITQFADATGLPEDDIRRIIHRPRPPAVSDPGPAAPADDTVSPSFRDP